MTGSRYGRSPAALWRSVGVEVLLTRSGQDEVDVLGGAASVTWHVLDRAMTLNDLVEALAEIFEIEESEIGDVVEDMVHDLCGRGWLRTVDA